MCISKAYYNKRENNTPFFDMISEVSMRDSRIVLRDLLGREEVVEGELTKVDLANGYIIITPADQSRASV